MHLEKIVLVDHDAAQVSAWREAFEEYPSVTPLESDFFSESADAMVSPANSFAIMDGGLDLAIRDTLGPHIQKAVQKVILDNHHGELAVGCAEIVETRHERWPHLVVAPTMRIPENVSNTTNAYLSFRAVLLAVGRHNAAQPDMAIRSLLCPGLGTGIGGMEAQRCAVQMRMAYKQVLAPARTPSFHAIHATHFALRSA